MRAMYAPMPRQRAGVMGTEHSTLLGMNVSRRTMWLPPGSEHSTSNANLYQTLKLLSVWTIREKSHYNNKSTTLQKFQTKISVILLLLLSCPRVSVDMYFPYLFLMGIGHWYPFLLRWSIMLFWPSTRAGLRESNAFSTFSTYPPVCTEVKWVLPSIDASTWPKK